MTEAEAKIKDLELQIKELNDKVDKLLAMRTTSLPYKADSVPQTQACNVMEL
jgi:hypothetical protein